MKKCMFAVLAGSFIALSAASVSADIGVNLKAGTLGAGVDLSKGLSNKLSISLGRRFGLSADIGVLYQGSPSLSLSATGALNDPTLAADLEAERQSAESDLSEYKWYPVLSLGTYYRF